MMLLQLRGLPMSGSSFPSYSLKYASVSQPITRPSTLLLGQNISAPGPRSSHTALTSNSQVENLENRHSRNLGVFTSKFPLENALGVFSFLLPPQNQTGNSQQSGALVPLPPVIVYKIITAAVIIYYFLRNSISRLSRAWLSSNLISLPEDKMRELNMVCSRVGWMMWSMQGLVWGNGELQEEGRRVFLHVYSLSCFEVIHTHFYQHPIPLYVYVSNRCI